jgi:hypothetical protein
MTVRLMETGRPIEYTTISRDLYFVMAPVQGSEGRECLSHEP